MKSTFPKRAFTQYINKREKRKNFAVDMHDNNANNELNASIIQKLH